MKHSRLSEIGIVLGAFAAVVLAAVAPALAQAEIPVPDAAAIPPEALAGGIVTVLVWAVRRLLIGAKGEPWLEARPSILAWTAAGMSLLAGAAVDIAASMQASPGGTIKAAAIAWLVSQGPRRLKKLVPVLAKSFK